MIQKNLLHNAKDLLKKASRKGSFLKSARLVELVDTTDLKSVDRKVVPVRLRQRAPQFKKGLKRPFFIA